MSGKFLAHGLLNLGVFWLPFPAIFLVIIEFFGAVGVSEVAVAFGSKAVVIVAKNRQGGFIPWGFRIFHQDGEVLSFQLPFRGLAASEGGLPPVRAARGG